MQVTHQSFARENMGTLKTSPVFVSIMISARSSLYRPKEGRSCPPAATWGVPIRSLNAVLGNAGSGEVDVNVVGSGEADAKAERERLMSGLRSISSGAPLID